VPQDSIPVSIHDGSHGQVFGLISNVSEAGASFACGVSYPAGSSILLRIAFDRDAEPFVTEAKIVWSREEDSRSGSRGFLQGVRFCIAEEEQQQQLRAILKRPEFKVVFRRNRQFPRLVPQGSIAVSIHDSSHGETFGSITNISEGGASFATGVSYAVGTSVLLRIRFDHGAEPFVTEGQIVWSSEEEGRSGSESFVHGVQFSRLEEEQMVELRTILKRPEFKVVFHPDLLPFTGPDAQSDPAGSPVETETGAPK
jgi:Tfp pilus assembly protein PilZ